MFYFFLFLAFSFSALIWSVKSFYMNSTNLDQVSWVWSAKLSKTNSKSFIPHCLEEQSWKLGLLWAWAVPLSWNAPFKGMSHCHPYYATYSLSSLIRYYSDMKRREWIILHIGTGIHKRYSSRFSQMLQLYFRPLSCQGKDLCFFRFNPLTDSIARCKSF